eukprot:m.108502 g.108502  ORF g.108502 m.108502 type:complete len:185 (+) comp15921_c0_seq1:676-1230(+)
MLAGDRGAQQWQKQHCDATARTAAVAGSATGPCPHRARASSPPRGCRLCRSQAEADQVLARALQRAPRGWQPPRAYFGANVQDTPVGPSFDRVMSILGQVSGVCDEYHADGRRQQPAVTNKHLAHFHVNDQARPEQTMRRAPAATVDLPPGTYTVTARLGRDGPATTQTVHIGPGEQIEIEMPG